jgi:hypothetical protein
MQFSDSRKSALTSRIISAALSMLSSISLGSVDGPGGVRSEGVAVDWPGVFLVGVDSRGIRCSPLFTSHRMRGDRW